MNRGKYIIATTRNPFHIMVNILDPLGHAFLEYATTRVIGQVREKLPPDLLLPILR